MRKTTKKAAPRKARPAQLDVELVLEAIRNTERTMASGFDVLTLRTSQLERQVTTIEKCVLPPVAVLPADVVEEKDRVTAGEVRVVPPSIFEQAVAALRGIEEAVVHIAERTQLLVELQLAKPPSKPRGRKATEPVAEGEGIKQNDVVDQGSPVEDPTASSSAPAPSIEEQVAAKGVEQVVREKAAELGVPAEVVREPVKEAPKLAVVPAPAGETKAEEVPFETLRAKAVEFAQKHTKAKLKEILAEVVGPDKKLSDVTDRAAFLARLSS